MPPVGAERWFHTLVVVGASLTGCGGATTDSGTPATSGSGGASSTGGTAGGGTASGGSASGGLDGGTLTSPSICKFAAQFVCDDYATREETRPLRLPHEPARPTFPVCSPRVHGALFAALHSAVNETIGVTYLSACFAEAQGRAAHRVVKELLSDEVRHSRIGWAVLASPQLDAQDRASIASFMPALLDVCVATWLADIETDYPRELTPGHGCINHVGIAQAVKDALHDVILPGLDHVGVDATAARQWVAKTEA